VSAADLLRELLAERLDRGALAWLEQAVAEVAAGVDPDRFAALIAVASRHVKRAPLEPSAEARARAAELVAGWDPQRWDRLDAARVLLALSLPEPEGMNAELLVEEAFRHADVGELVALHRALPLLPRPERFGWRVGEGARTNMRAVFEAACCDNPFPERHFDDVAWRSAVLKALFVGAPLWRVWGLDGRLDEELARMALDYADERRSADRPVPHELWLCLGAHGGERARESLDRELAGGVRPGRAAAALALARAGRLERLAQAARDEDDPWVRAIMERALEGESGQAAFAALEHA
jgi:hypothetical protein